MPSIWPSRSTVEAEKNPQTITNEYKKRKPAVHRLRMSEIIQPGIEWLMESRYFSDLRAGKQSKRRSRNIWR